MTRTIVRNDSIDIYARGARGARISSNHRHNKRVGRTESKFWKQIDLIEKKYLYKPTKELDLDLDLDLDLYPYSNLISYSYNSVQAMNRKLYLDSYSDLNKITCQITYPTTYSYISAQANISSDKTNVSSVEELIAKTSTNKISEDPKDIEDLGDIIRCKLCNIKSGTWKIIGHSFKCKYCSNSNSDTLIYGNCTRATIPIVPSKAEEVKMREAIIIDKDSKIKVLGTFGAGPCIIVGIRDRITTKTLLSHVDALSLDPINIFNGFPSDTSDVYLIGGNSTSTSKEKINDLISKIVSRGFVIKYAYLVDSNSNSFGINAESGEVYVNTVKPSELTITYNKSARSNNKLTDLFLQMQSPIQIIRI